MIANFTRWTAFRVENCSKKSSNSWIYTRRRQPKKSPLKLKIFTILNKHLQYARNKMASPAYQTLNIEWNQLWNRIVQKYLNMQLANARMQSFLCTNAVWCFHFLIIILTNTQVNEAMFTDEMLTNRISNARIRTNSHRIHGFIYRWHLKFELKLSKIPTKPSWKREIVQSKIRFD